MRLLISACIHIRDSIPKARKDDFPAVQFKKFVWLVKEAIERKAALVIAGDMFDTPELPYDLLFRYLEVLWAHDDLEVFVVYGQHDLRHRQREATPLYFFHRLGVVTILGPDPWRHESEALSLYGWSWDEPEMPQVHDMNTNILVAHKMIADSPLWPGQKKFVSTKDILTRQHGYKLVASGDNHQTVICGDKRMDIVNPGTLVRQKINELRHMPIVVLYDTQREAVIETIPVPHTDPNEVFDVETYAQVKTIEGKVQAFVEMVGKAEFGEVEDIDVAARQLLDALEVKPEIVELVLEFIEEAKLRVQTS